MGQNVFFPVTSFHGHASNTSNSDICALQTFDMIIRNLQHVGLIRSKMMLLWHLWKPALWSYKLGGNYTPTHLVIYGFTRGSIAQ